MTAARWGVRPSGGASVRPRVGLRFCQDERVRAVQYEQFGVRPVIVDLPTPTPPSDGVVVRVAATGV